MTSAAPALFVTHQPCPACCLDARVNEGPGCRLCDFQHDHGSHQSAAPAPGPKEETR
jgi:hypothetical protein